MVGFAPEPWLIHFGKGDVKELEMRKLPSLLPEFQVMSCQSSQLLLRPTQTERDYTTRRDFFVFKNKQNRQGKEIL